MTQKHYFFVSTLLILLVIFSLFWLKTPNADEKAIHVATFCNVIKKNPELSAEKEILEQVKFTYGNSTPSYAFKKPKFYEAFTYDLIDHYLSLDPETQQNHKNNYDLCFKNMNQ